MKDRRKQWWLLYMVVAFTFLAFVVSFPAIPIKFNLLGKQIDMVIQGPDIDWQIGGRQFQKELNLKLGLDLQGGTHLALRGDMEDIPEEERENAIESARTIMEQRVNLFGVSEPNVYTSKSGDEYRIIVELAGVHDVDSAVALVGQTARLEFREWTEAVDNPENPYAAYLAESYAETDISGADLDGATVQIDPNTGNPVIQLNFSSEGRAKFSELAKRSINKPIAIVLDGQVISAPNVSEDLAAGVTGDPVISGSFTKEQAEALETQLDAGALPVPVEVVEQRTIEATLGEESINKSMIAGVIGVGIIMIFMIYNYGFLGFIADVALLMYSLFSLSIFKVGAPALVLWVFTGDIGEDVLVPVTLTLAGIAGFILSIGVAVDANILIFERVKEEIRWGTPKAEALKLGFERAWTSIRDSNVSTLITCIILGHFGTGAIKGFAVTLALGVLVSLFTAVTVTRTMVNLFYRSK